MPVSLKKVIYMSFNTWFKLFGEPQIAGLLQTKSLLLLVLCRQIFSKLSLKLFRYAFLELDGDLNI